MDRKRIIAIDYGIARIGLAYSDETKLIAMTMTTIAAEKKLEKTVEKVVQHLLEHSKNYSYKIEEVVVGMPYLFSGKSGMMADEVKAFIDELSKRLDVKIVPWDERLTTVLAERAMREGHMTRKKRAKIVDVVSAVVLLQSYLDYKGK